MRIINDPLARHLPDIPEMYIGFIEEYSPTGRGDYIVSENHRLLNEHAVDSAFGKSLGHLFKIKAEIDGTKYAWNFINVLFQDKPHDSWLKAFAALEDSELHRLWVGTSRQSGGSRQHWVPVFHRTITPRLTKHPVQIIPAIRQIGDGGSVSEGFDGLGIIDRLAKLQDPDVHNQGLRERFGEITRFVQVVLDSPNAKISIPYQRDTILVHMNGKVLPIESLGSGIHEVVIIAAAATTLSNTIVCIEEPEIHLNPILQKKLLRYLKDKTTNQYFIATHSAALMDTEGAEIYHVTQTSGESRVERVTSNSKRSNVCEDLGYHPSDILQSNCVIWVEGPSDRIYINYWIKAKHPKLIEGVHYSVMFYGGRLAAHVSNLDIDEEIEDFISLRRLNRRGAILIDSDKDSPGARINTTKSRLRTEFERDAGVAWITAGREVENYVPATQIAQALADVAPRCKPLAKYGRYDNTLRLQTSKGETQANKVKVAKYVVENFVPDFSCLDLDKKITELVRFVAESNKTQILG